MNVAYDPPSKEMEYPGHFRAACCISLDFDHLTHLEPSVWSPVPSAERLALNKIGTETILKLSEKYEVPITWAICGSTAEADFPSYEKIRNSQVKHEIAIHSYSHLDVALCSKEELMSDLLKCVETLKLDQFPETFVFPWNRSGHFDTLKELGFKAYRSKDRRIGAPSRNSYGLLDIAPVYFLDESALNSFEKIKLYLDICIAHRAVFHVWSHPWGLVSIDQGRSLLLQKLVEQLFDYLARKRSDGVLWITTMGNLARVLQL